MGIEERPTNSSRRDFLEATASGAIGLSAGLVSSGIAAAPDIDSNSADPGILSILSQQSIRAGSASDLNLRFKTNLDLRSGAKLWLFFDVRQGAEVGQTEDSEAPDFLSVKLSANPDSSVAIETPRIPRTFDLFPTTPEFLHLIQVTIDRPAAAGSMLDFAIRGWQGPRQPIDPFRFWLVVDHEAEWDFVPIGFRRYRKFVERGSDVRIATDKLLGQTVTASLNVTGEYSAVPKISHRRTPGVFWGEFHGMVFNQRPLDDYYNYAKKVTQLDFCAPFWFSYNTCVGQVWNEVKNAARRHTQRGHFIAIPGFECGTPPDGSHRCVLFRNADNVPPIFCEDRPPAQEAFFQKRLHPDTIICKTPDELYKAVKKHDGIVTGHFHTLSYHKEVLCEMFQKNLVAPEMEEQRLYGLLREGHRFALAATSDTHDSMPGNPRPEPHLSMAAGFTGVHAKQLTVDALFDAVLARRIYATSGARIFMNFQSHKRPMGAELPMSAPREFQINIDGTAKLSLVELLRDGHPIQNWSPANSVFAISTKDTKFDRTKPAFYLVRVTQTDAHKGWTSPIWFG